MFSADEERAIVRLLNTYSDAVNRRDWPTLENVFTSDGVWDIGGDDGGDMKFVVTGNKAIVDMIAELVEPREFLIQKNSAMVITQIGPDAATSSSLLEELSRFPGAEDGNQSIGIYKDDIVRESDGQWRFKKRVFNFVYTGLTPMAGVVHYKYPTRE